MDPRAIEVSTAHAEEQDGRPLVIVNGESLRTPAGNLVEPPAMELAGALAEEIEADGVADVTRPSLFALYCTQRDFIEPNPTRTVEALVELLAHDYLLHPEAQLGRRQAQVAAWAPQIALWQSLTDSDPPYAPPNGEPAIRFSAAEAFRRTLAALTPAQLSVAIHAANLLKSATLGILLAQMAIDAAAAKAAVAVTLRVTLAETADELEAQEEREEYWQRIIDRLLRYAALSRRP